MYRREPRHRPQWFLLLVAVLGILSGCRSSRDLEAFARRHLETLNEALGLDFKRWPSDATFIYLFNKAHLQEFGDVLQAWMISQIPGGAEVLDQLVCAGKTLRGSAVQTEDGSHRFVAQVTVYARALGVVSTTEWERAGVLSRVTVDPTNLLINRKQSFYRIRFRLLLHKRLRNGMFSTKLS